MYDEAVHKAFAPEIKALCGQLPKRSDENKTIKKFIASLAVEAEWTHRQYIEDDEYIPYGEDIDAFLIREIAKPIVFRQDSPHLGYEVLPNKYFYRYQPPVPAKELLEEFWKLEKNAEELLKGLAG
jgi:type I restriction enzyme M protein